MLPKHWKDDFSKLSFVDKHTVLASVSGIVTTVLFGVLTGVLSWTQITSEARVRRAAMIEEVNKRNLEEARQANFWFGDHAKTPDAGAAGANAAAVGASHAPRAGP